MKEQLTYEKQIYISTALAADITGYSQGHVRLLASDGHINTVKVAGRRYVERDDVFQYALDNKKNFSINRIPLRHRSDALVASPAASDRSSDTSSAETTATSHGVSRLPAIAMALILVTSLVIGFAGLSPSADREDTQAASRTTEFKEARTDLAVADGRSDKVSSASRGDGRNYIAAAVSALDTSLIRPVRDLFINTYYTGLAGLLRVGDALIAGNMPDYTAPDLTLPPATEADVEPTEQQSFVAQAGTSYLRDQLFIRVLTQLTGVTARLAANQDQEPREVELHASARNYVEDRLEELKIMMYKNDEAVLDAAQYRLPDDVDFEDLFVTEDTVIGNEANADTISIVSRFISSLIPSTTATYDIGSASLRFASGYFSNSLDVGTLQLAGGSITDTSGAIDFDNEDLSTTGGLSVGNATTTGDTVIGTNATNTLTVNASLASSLTPDADNVYDLGSLSNKWSTVYVDTISANNIAAASTTVSGTAVSDFTINTDNSSQDTEDASLIFSRGQVSPDAVFAWDAALDRFDLNQTLYIQNDSASTTNPTIVAQAVSGQTANLLELASSSGAVLMSIRADGTVVAPTASTTNTQTTNLTAQDATTTNLTALGQTDLATTSITDLSASSTDSTILVSEDGTITNLVVTNSTTTNATTTNSYVVNLSADNADIVDLVAQNASTTNFFAQNLTADSGDITDLTATNATSTNFYSSVANFAQAFFTSFSATDGDITNLTADNATTTNLVTTDLSATGTTDLATTTVTGDLAVNTDDLFVDTATGNVGVGIVSPTAPLHVQIGNGANGPILTLQGYSGSGGSESKLRFAGTQIGGKTWDIRADGGGIVGGYFGVTDVAAGADRLFIDTNGNVGIGDDLFAPGSRLSVSGGVSVGSSYAGTAAPSNGAIIKGNVGIGTSSPARTLDVAGSYVLRGAGGSSGAGVFDPDSVHIGAYGGDYGFGADSAQISFASAQGQDLKIQYTRTGYARWKQIFANSTMEWQNNLGDTVFYANGSGQVGIGTTNPATILDVAGTTTAEAFAVGGDTITDFTGTGLSVSGNILQVDQSALNVDNFGTSLTAGSIAFSDGSTLTEDNANLFWDNANNRLGIGTNSPGSSLDIGFNGNNTTARIGYDASNMLELGFKTGSNFIQATDQTSSNGNGLALNPDGGSVGIGTTSPQSLLTLAGQANPTLTIKSNITGGSTKGTLRFEDLTGTNAEISLSANNLALDADEVRALNNLRVGGEIYTNTLYSISSAPLAFGSILNGTAMVLDNNAGNLGIGATNPAERLQVAGAAEIDGRTATTTNTNVRDIVLTKDGQPLLTHQTAYWDGSAFQPTDGYGLGQQALENNTGIYANSFGHNSLQNNTGDFASGFGYAALRNNTGANASGFGYQALENNTGTFASGFGYDALQNNSGDRSYGFGRQALVNNNGDNANGFGLQALRVNTGNRANGFGNYALMNNTGNYANGFGYRALVGNTGNNSNGFGYFSLAKNAGDNNTALGHWAGYVSADVLTGAGNTFLGANSTYGTSTITNSTAVGANITLTDSNTVVLGNNANVGIGTTNPTTLLSLNPPTGKSGTMSFDINETNKFNFTWANEAFMTFGRDFDALKLWGSISPGRATEIRGGASDGASAVGTIIDNAATLSTAGSKLVSFQNNTVEKAFIDKDGGGYFGGNVGIGVASPSYPLDISGGGVNRFQVGFDSDGIEYTNNNGLGFFNVDIGSGGNVQSGLLSFTGANTDMKIRPGIEGQPTGFLPRQLQLGTIQSQTTAQLDADWDDVVITRDLDGASTYSEAGSNLRLYRDITNVTSESGNFFEWANASGTLGVIDADGSLGIGTTSPSETLTVDGTANISGGTGNTGLFVDSAGFVGAGTTTPATALDVAGTASTQGLDVTGTTTLTGNVDMTGNIIPTEDITYDLGSEDFQWRDVFIGPGSLYINGKKVIQDISDTITVSTDDDQNLMMETSGVGVVTTRATGSGNANILANSGNININSTSGIVNVGTTGISYVNLGTVASGVWNGTTIDVSDYTNLGVTATGLSLAGDNVALTSGYQIPLTASTTDWENFFNTPSTRVSAGTGLTWAGNTLNAADVDSQSTSLSAGSIAFSDGSTLTEDNANLFWDDANNRLGVGVNSPGASLDVADEIRIQDPDNANVGSFIRKQGSLLTIFSGSTSGGRLVLSTGGNPYGSKQFEMELVNNFSGGNDYSGLDFKGSNLPLAISHNKGLMINGSGGTFPSIFAATSTNVGIGTTTPSERLTVDGSANFTGSITANAATFASAVFDTITSTLGSFTNLEADNATTTNLVATDITTTDLAAAGTITTGLTTGSVPFIGASNEVAEDNANLFWDDANNRLGIGTASPEAPLEIGTLGTNDEALIVPNEGKFIFRDSAGSKRHIMELTSANVMLYRNPVGSVALQSGTGNNVGIGTTNPTEKLQVAGAAEIDGRTATTTDTNVRDLVLTKDAQPLLTHQTAYWNGTSFVDTNGYGLGYQALQNNTGNNANGFGYRALYNNTGFGASGFGHYALFNNTGFGANGFGYRALFNNTGNNASGFGYQALENNTGNNANGFGYRALFNNTGANNTAFGYQAGYDAATLDGAGNTFLGANSTYGTSTIANSTAVGANITLTDSNTVVLGNNANVGIGTASPTSLLTLSSPAPKFLISESDQGADAKSWGMAASGGIFYGYARNDADNLSSNWLQVDRSGANVSTVSFPNGNVGIGTTNPGEKLDVAGNIEVSGNIEDSSGDLSIGANGNVYIESYGGEVARFRNTGTNFKSKIGININTGTINNSRSVFNQNITVGENNGSLRNIVSKYTSSFNNASGTVIGLDIDTSNAQGGTNYAALLNGGNVGIGTTTPSEKLTVDGSARVTGSITANAATFASAVFDTITSTLGSFTNLEADNATTTNLVATDITTTDLAAAGTITTGLTTGSLPFIGASNEVAEDNANLFWNDANNRLGIGTGSPTEALDVVGGMIRGQTLSSAGTATGLALYHGDNTFDNELDLKLYPRGTSAPTNWSGLRSVASFGPDAELAFMTSDGGAVAEQMRVTAAGNVGIGTTSPSEKLTVDGSARVTGSITANAATFASAVFDTITSTLGSFTNLEADNATTTNLVATDITTTDLAAAGTITTGLTTGSLPFIGASKEVAEDNQQLFWDDANNRLGIGTSTPEYALDVDGGIRLPNSGANEDSPPSSKAVFINDTSGNAYPALYGTAANDVVVGGLASSPGYFRLSSGGNIILDTNTSNSTRSIDLNGNGNTRLSVFPAGVSIGSKFEPTNVLDVNAGTVIGSSYAGIETAPTDGLLVEGNVGIGTTSPQDKLDVWGNLRVGTSSTPTLFANTATERVGIGTTSPSEKLSVAGYGSFDSGIKINSSHTSDTTWTIEQRDDEKNSLRDALYITPSNDSHRLFFGDSTASLFSIDFSYVNKLDQLPDLDLGGTNRLFYGGISNSIERESNALRLTGAGPTTGGIRFYTGDSFDYSLATESMRIDGLTGNVGIGTTSPTTTLDVAGTISQTNALDCELAVNTAGDLICSGTSDRNLKTNVESLDTESMLTKLADLEAKSFRFRPEAKLGDEQQIGFIAQDVKKVFPELVGEINGTMFVNYSKMTAVLTGAVQELNRKVQILEEDYTYTTKVDGEEVPREAFIAAVGATLEGYMDTFTARFEEVVARRVTAEEELCINDTCINEEQLKQLIEQMEDPKSSDNDRASGDSSPLLEPSDSTDGSTGGDADQDAGGTDTDSDITSDDTGSGEGDADAGQGGTSTTTDDTTGTDSDSSTDAGADESTDGETDSTTTQTEDPDPSSSEDDQASTEDGSDGETSNQTSNDAGSGQAPNESTDSDEASSTNETEEDAATNGSETENTNEETDPADQDPSGDEAGGSGQEDADSSDSPAEDDTSDQTSNNDSGDQTADQN